LSIENEKLVWNNSEITTYHISYIMLRQSKKVHSKTLASNHVSENRGDWEVVIQSLVQKTKKPRKEHQILLNQTKSKELA
jgi:hypothetical protein